VVVKAEDNEKGTNRRFVVTNRPGAVVLPGPTYDDYAERGEKTRYSKACGIERIAMMAGQVISISIPSGRA
jgi:hypothetical protein